MDVKELNRFESVYQPSKEIAFCWRVKKYVQLSVEENHTEVVDHANDSLRIWQASKSQAVPVGYKVVPVNYECAWCGCTELDGWTDEAMIEAQEQDKDAICHHQWVDGLDGGTMVCANKCGAWK